MLMSTAACHAGHANKNRSSIAQVGHLRGCKPASQPRLVSQRSSRQIVRWSTFNMQVAMASSPTAGDLDGEAFIALKNRHGDDPELAKALTKEYDTLQHAFDHNRGKRGASAELEELARMVLGDKQTGTHEIATRTEEFTRMASEARLQEDTYIPGMAALAQVFEEGLCGAPVDWLCAAEFYERSIACESSNLARFSLATHLEMMDDASVWRARDLYELVVEEADYDIAALRLAKLVVRRFMGDGEATERAVRLFQRALENGPPAACVDAMDSLGEMYASGRPGCRQDQVRAVELFERSIRDYESTRAMCGLARLFQSGGEVVKRDMRRARQLYEQAIAIDENPNTLVDLALLLTEDVNRHTDEVISLYERAVAKGSNQAIRNLAYLYDFGEEGVPVNRKRALELYEALASTEYYKRERFNVAFLISSGIDEAIEQDFPRAVGLYEEILAEEPSLPALSNLAGILTNEQAGIMNFSRAFDLYEQAIANHGDLLSMQNLAFLLTRDHDGIEKDRSRAVSLLETAAERGSKAARIELGVLLSGCLDNEPIDVDRGLRILEVAAEEMYSLSAILQLAVIYGEALYGIAADAGKAVQLSERAIALGIRDEKELTELGIRCAPIEITTDDEQVVNMLRHSCAEGIHLVIMRNLAEMYLAGKPDLPMDVERAVLLLTRALTDETAREVFSWRKFEDILGYTVKMTHMPEAGIDRFANAVRIYELIIAASDHSSHAMCLLAGVLMDGAEGVPRDAGRAVEVYEKAVMNGDNNAMLALGEVVMVETADVPMDRRRAVDLFARVVCEEDDDRWDLRREAVVNIANLLLRKPRKDGSGE